MSAPTTAQPDKGASLGLTREQTLWDALAHGPKTFGDLWPRANEAVGDFPGDHHAPGYRFTDRWLQKGRRNGWMRVTRVGSKSVWSLTDAGRAALSKSRASGAEVDHG